MNTHKNARLTFARRMKLVQDIVSRGRTPCAGAAAHGVSAPTARTWLGRFGAGCYRRWTATSGQALRTQIRRGSRH